MSTPPLPRFYKVNPDCEGDRHRPGHRAYIRGCRCPETIAAEKDYQENYEPHRVNRPVRHQVQGDPNCRGQRHTPFNDSYRRGCRCPGAIEAHERWMADRRVEREQAIAIFKETGKCGAGVHDSVRAYRQFGCRCPAAVKLQALREKALKRRPETTSYKLLGNHRTLRFPVDRIDLMHALAGLCRNPAVGVVIAADAVLSRRLVPDGPLYARRMTVTEIAARIGIGERQLMRIRNDRVRARENRHLRRLADVKARALRVAKAREVR